MSDQPSHPQSFWLADLGPLEARPALESDETVDVAIIGAGYTGLWTAYYLSVHSPETKVAILESQVAGFGASGRNGGWCSPNHEGMQGWLGGPKHDRAIALQHAMFDAIDEIGRVAGAEAIDCDYVKSGLLQVATSDAERARAQPILAQLHAHGFKEDDYRWLDTAACDEHVRIASARGGMHSPHGATVQPAKLARGLARAVEGRGVTVYENSAARSVAAGEVTTDRGRLRARVVLRCTEGYTPLLPGLKRKILPMHPVMVATAPLPDAAWAEIGAADRILFGDLHRNLTWAQRTADGRIAIGKGGSYFYGSKVREDFAPDSPMFAPAEQVLRDLFPSLGDIEITHRWGGPIGIARDMTPFVRFDASSGMGAAGGYVGSGVTTSNLAGRTLADLILGRDTERLTYPWVQHRSPAWEPEPLRWLGARTVWGMAVAADRAEERGRAGGLSGAIFRSVSGH